MVDRSRSRSPARKSRTKPRSHSPALAAPTSSAPLPPFDACANLATMTSTLATLWSLLFAGVVYVCLDKCAEHADCLNLSALILGLPEVLSVPLTVIYTCLVRLPFVSTLATLWSPLFAGVVYVWPKLPALILGQPEVLPFVSGGLMFFYLTSSAAWKTIIGACWWKLIIATLLTPIYLPTLLLVWRDLDQYPLVDRKWSPWLHRYTFNYATMLFSTMFWMISGTRLMVDLNIFPKSDTLRMTNLYGVALGLQIHDRHWTDFSRTWRRQAVYILNYYENQLRDLLNRAHPIADLPQHSADDCKAALLHALLGGPLSWNAKLTRENGHQLWTVTFEEGAIPGLHAWYNLPVQHIKFKYLGKKWTDASGLHLEDWDIAIDLHDTDTNPGAAQQDIHCSHFDISPELFELRAAVATVAYGSITVMHSWIHFPYEDFLSVWVANKQDEGADPVKNPFFGIALVHSYGSKWNAVLVKEKDRVTDSIFDPNSTKSSPDIYIPTNKDGAFMAIGGAFMAEATKLEPEAFRVPAGKKTFDDYDDQLGYIKTCHKSRTAVRAFVEEVWPQIETEAREFVDFVRVFSHHKCDFRNREKEFITRVIWTQTIHCEDHAWLTIQGQKYPSLFQTVAPECASEEYQTGINQLWMSNRFRSNVCKFDNFAMTYSNYTYVPRTTETIKTFDYHNPALNDAQETLRGALLECRVDMAERLDRLGYSDKHYNRENYIKYAPVSIDH